MTSDLVGLEFDWFAMDEQGELALFATAGEGPIPPSALRSQRAHSAVADSLAAPRFGTVEVWDDFAAVGLFVYDWALPGGPYRRMAVPRAQPSTAMRTSIEQIADLPRFSFNFSSTIEV